MQSTPRADMGCPGVGDGVRVSGDVVHLEPYAEAVEGVRHPPLRVREIGQHHLGKLALRMH
jgi:hypothetical protein